MWYFKGQLVQDSSLVQVGEFRMAVLPNSLLDRAGYVRLSGPFAVPIGPDDHFCMAVAVYIACRAHRMAEPAIELLAVKDE
jgi:hypothetical protein